MRRFYAFSALIFFPLMIQAQLCDGGYGEPVFEETFGTNGMETDSYGSPLPDGTTTYFNDINGEIEDGSYTIATNGRLGRNGWHNINDHTSDLLGEGKGYMLLVNAAFTPGEFYRSTVDGLCSGQVYEFSAFFVNLLPSTFTACGPLVPNDIIFRIEDNTGNSLGELATGVINSTSSPEWEKYAFDFKVPSGVSNVQLVLINNGPGGCGNDLAIDDISFRPCSSGATVTTNYPDFERGVCDDAQLELFANIDEGTYRVPEFRWQESTNGGFSWTDIEGETNASILVSGFSNGHQYRYLVSEEGNIDNINCRAGSRSIEVVYLNTIENDPTDIQRCDFFRTGVDFFDLTLREELIVGTQNTANLRINYYESLADAEQETNPIQNPENYTNLMNPQLIYVRVDDVRKQCFNIADFSLELIALTTSESSLSFSVDILDGDFYNTLIVNVSQDGNFEYIIDDMPPQDSNVFENVSPGLHAVTVTSHEPCALGGPIDLCVVNFPKFFTPNGDGINDYWNIDDGETTCFGANSIVSIFNRFGNLLSRFSSSENGWDGRFNGKLLPSTDYWFLIENNDETQRQIKGHFSLKR